MQRGAAPPPVDTWEHDWRGEVMRQLRQIDEAHQAAVARQAEQQAAAAVIMERLSNRLDAVQKEHDLRIDAVKKEHDQRIKALEEQPAQQRQQLTLDFRMWSLIISVVALAYSFLHSATITLH